MTVQKLSEILQSDVSDLRYFSSGQIGDVYQAAFERHEIVIKTDPLQSGDLLTEARMLQDLAENGLRVPEVIASAADVLVLSYNFV